MINYWVEILTLTTILLLMIPLWLTYVIICSSVWLLVLKLFPKSRAFSLKHSGDPPSIDKFAAFPCSWDKTQLGLYIYIRSMSISLPTDKLLRLVSTLTFTWHIARKCFTLLEIVTLLRYLEHAYAVYPWRNYLFCALRSAFNIYLKTGTRHTMATLSGLATMVSTGRDAKIADEQLLFHVFIQKKVSKSLYQS